MKAKQDINILLNITDILTQCFRYHQIYTYTCTIHVYLRDCITYMKHVTTHTMDYVDTTTANILSLDILPVERKGMLRHTESQLPSIMHLPISLDNTHHFYRYLKPHVLVAEEQFFLLIDVPTQDRAQQLQIYEIVIPPVPHVDISARYKISDKYIGITFEETQAVVITEQKYSSCLHTNSQFAKWMHHSRLLQIHKHGQWPHMSRTSRK